MNVYLIRHPKPSDIEGRCYGRLDVPVDPTLRVMTITKVRESIPAAVLRYAPIFSSPLSRCVQFAGELAHPRTPVIAEELVEMNFGSWEGRRWNDVPREELDHWARDLWSYRPGGGESAQTLAGRWRRWLRQVSASSSDTVVAVTHAGVIRVALACAGRLNLNDVGRSTIEFGSIHCIDYRDTMHAATSSMRAGA